VWTTTKLAKAASVDPSAIRHLLLSGSLQGEKLGRDWLITDEEAQRYLAQRRARGQLPQPDKHEDTT
jgi:hypothetical protein